MLLIKSGDHNCFQLLLVYSSYCWRNTTASYFSKIFTPLMHRENYSSCTNTLIHTAAKFLSMTTRAKVHVQFTGNINSQIISYCMFFHAYIAKYKYNASFLNKINNVLYIFLTEVCIEKGTKVCDNAMTRVASLSSTNTDWKWSPSYLLTLYRNQSYIIHVTQSKTLRNTSLLGIT